MIAISLFIMKQYIYILTKTAFETCRVKNDRFSGEPKNINTLVRRAYALKISEAHTGFYDHTYKLKRQLKYETIRINTVL